MYLKRLDRKPALWRRSIGLVDWMAAERERQQIETAARSPDGREVVWLFEPFPMFTGAPPRPGEKRTLPMVAMLRNGGPAFYGPGVLVGWLALDRRQRGDRMGPITEGVREWLTDTIPPEAFQISLTAMGPITSHGFSINVAPDLSAIRAAQGKDATSIAAKLGYNPGVGEVADALLPGFVRRFGNVTIIRD